MPYPTPPLSNASLGTSVDGGSAAGLAQQAPAKSYYPLVPDGAQLTPPMMPVSTASDDAGLYRYHKQISKSFQDDLIYCPRALLSKVELTQCYQLDMLLLMEQQQQAQPSVKFNPYTSQSFNPAGPASPGS
ncbi:AaceriAFL135Wp [[Ashbya] aceris (nom. inval.)]|nr:AaceriAFL135Wp [[Ashbya] aceris (nom. inval.)]